MDLDLREGSYLRNLRTHEISSVTKAYARCHSAELPAQPRHFQTHGLCSLCNPVGPGGPCGGWFWGQRCRGSGCCLALSEQRLCWAAPWLLRSYLDTCLQVPSVSPFTETGRNAMVRGCQVPRALGQASCRAWSLWRPRGSHLVSLLVFNEY